MTSAETDHGRLLPLLQRLLEQTRDEKISWATASSASSFVAEFLSGSVALWSRDDDGLPPLIVNVLNDKGQVIAEGITEYGEDPFSHDREYLQGPWNGVLSALYQAARSAALAIDKTLEGLFDDVEAGRQPNDDDIPF